MKESELYHHGILGMKWGVRRYQNKDGSLTSAGKARYGIGDKKREKYEKKAYDHAIKAAESVGAERVVPYYRGNGALAMEGKGHSRIVEAYSNVGKKFNGSVNNLETLKKEVYKEFEKEYLRDLQRNKHYKKAVKFADAVDSKWVSEVTDAALIIGKQNVDDFLDFLYD